MKKNLLYILVLAGFLVFANALAQVATTQGPYDTNDTNIKVGPYQASPMPTGAYIWSNANLYPTPTFDPQREQVSLTGKDNTNDYVTLQRSSSAAYSHPRGSKLYFNSTDTPTTTPSATNTPTNTPTSTATNTPTITNTNTATNTPTNTLTFTPTPVGTVNTSWYNTMADLVAELNRVTLKQTPEAVPTAARTPKAP